MQHNRLKKIYFRYAYFVILLFIGGFLWQKEPMKRENEAIAVQFDLNCEAVIQEDRAELERVERLKSAKKIESQSLGDGEIAYLVHSGSCPEFIKLRDYPSSDANSDFPLAYSIVLHKNPGQAERLLRAIYSPHNVYCLHIDAKTPQMEVDDFEALASCFPNVFLTKKRENVHWGSYERFQADINCMEDLIQAEDFPLKSNSEIVNYLKSFYPKNAITSYKPSEKKKERFEKEWKIGPSDLTQADYREYKFIPVVTGRDKSPPPGHIEIFSGSAYFLMTREFVQWTLESEEVRELIEWSKDTFSPDEFVWATIVRSKNAPGNNFYYENGIENLSRISIWLTDTIHKCQGHLRRGVCVFGSGDLGWLLKQPHLFANKFDATDDFAMQCLEKELKKRN